MSAKEKGPPQNNSVKALGGLMKEIQLSEIVDNLLPEEEMSRIKKYEELLAMRLNDLDKLYPEGIPQDIRDMIGDQTAEEVPGVNEAISKYFDLLDILRTNEKSDRNMIQ